MRKIYKTQMGSFNVLIKFSCLGKLLLFADIMQLGQSVKISQHTFRHPHKLDNRIVIYGSESLDEEDNLNNVEFAKTLLICRGHIETCSQIEEELGTTLTLSQNEKLQKDVLPPRMSVLEEFFYHHDTRLVLTIPLKRKRKQKEDEYWKKRLRLAADEDKQNVKLRDCVLCMNAPGSVMVYPCQHTCMCADCSIEFYEKDDIAKTCPLCREKIEKLLAALI